jgi:hypothetical protein
MANREIVLRTQFGFIRKKIEVRMLSDGRRAIRCNDGTFTYCRAIGNDGTIYETKSKYGDWKVAKRQ